MKTRKANPFICISVCLMSCLWPAVASGVEVDLNTSEIPELADWGQTAKDLAAKWHPRLCNLLASKGYKPAETVRITLKKSDRGIADTSRGNLIRVYSNWIEKRPEDIGLVVHELVHVIQGYGHGGHPWLTEGIADYIRWAIYEGKPLKWFPLSKKADGYKQGYQVTGGFFLWLESDRAPGIVKKLNASLRKHKYSAAIFEDETGLTLEDLWSEYVKERTQPPATAQKD